MTSRKDDTGVEDIFSYMCSLAVAKCSLKGEKKKASCGGDPMRKRLLIKNFVTQLLEKERQMGCDREQLSREVNIPRQRYHHSKNIQTQIQDDDQMEEEADDIDEGLDEEYQPAESTDFSDEEPLDEVTSDDEDLDDQTDSLNNNSKLDSKQLPGIGSLDLDAQNRPFGPNPYLSVDSSLSNICDDDSNDLSDDLSSENFELFGSKSNSTTTSIGMKQSAPSWHEPEADLFLLERSTTSLYYDDYTSVQTTTASTDSYGLSYRHHEDFSVPATTLAPSSEHYHLSTSVTDTTSSFLISSSNTEHSVPSVHTLLTNESNARHPVQLPENFMDDTLIGRNDLSNVTSIASSLTTSINTTNSYAELHHSNQSISSDKMSSMTSSGGYHANYACNNELDSVANNIDLCVEEKANNGNSVVVVDQNEDEEEASDNEDEQQRIVSSAFVDLINIAPSPVNKMRLGDCRTEALQESCFGQSRHITDLDSQLTLIEDDEFADVNSQLGSHHLMMSDTNYDPLLLQSSPSLTDLISSDVYSVTQQQNVPVSGVNRSPRKRLNQLDYGLMFKAMSPKRIKL